MTGTQTRNADELAIATAPKCHACRKQEPKVDLIHCSHIQCDRAVCNECATELEWEMESCTEHSLSVFMDLRDMYRNALRRSTERMAA